MSPTMRILKNDNINLGKKLLIQIYGTGRIDSVVINETIEFNFDTVVVSSDVVEVTMDTVNDILVPVKIESI